MNAEQLAAYAAMDNLDTEATDRLMADLGVTMAVTHLGMGEALLDSGRIWEYDSYEIVMTTPGTGGAYLRVPSYRTGIAHRGKEPSAYDIWTCLVSDLFSILNSRGFVEWAKELGYNPDSRKDQKIYQACLRESRRVQSFLATVAAGHGLDYDALLEVMAHIQ